MASLTDGRVTPLVLGLVVVVVVVVVVVESVCVVVVRVVVVWVVVVTVDDVVAGHASCPGRQSSAPLHARPSASACV